VAQVAVAHGLGFAAQSRERFRDVDRRRSLVARLQYRHRLGLLPSLPGQVGKRTRRQRQALWRVLVQAKQGVKRPRCVATLRLVRRHCQPAARQLRRVLYGLFEQTHGAFTITTALCDFSLFAQVVGEPGREAPLLSCLQLLRDLLGLRPIA